MVTSKTTVYVDADDQPVIAADDGEVVIAIPGIECSWDICINPSVFPAIREAMQKAEERK